MFSNVKLTVSITESADAVFDVVIEHLSDGKYEAEIESLGLHATADGVKDALHGLVLLIQKNNTPPLNTPIKFGR